MRNIFLTFHLDVNEPCFDDLTDAYKINGSDLLRKYSYDMFRHTDAQRLSFIAGGILQTEGSILVGLAGYDYSDFMRIHKALREGGAGVTAIFIPSRDRLAAELKEGQEIYRQHNRWLDFPPGHIEDVHEQRVKTINEIQGGFVSTGVKIIAK